MDTLRDTFAWLVAGENWTGPDGIPTRLLQHVELSGIAMVLAVAVALPIALGLGHWGRGGFVAINASNVGRAIPTLAVLVVLAVTPAIGIGNTAAVLALVLFAIPPVLTNGYVAMRGVDADVKESARGMGMTGGQLLRRVEVPLALPLIAAGVRTAAVQVIATATLAALVGSGGLGRYIIDGYAVLDYPQVYGGVVLVALLAVLTEVALGAVQRLLTPGRRGGGGGVGAAGDVAGDATGPGGSDEPEEAALAATNS